MEQYVLNQDLFQDAVCFVSSNRMAHLMDLLEDLVAHDGHPGECGQEEELVKMSQDGAADLRELAAVVLVDDEDQESQQERSCKVQHDLIIAGL